MQNSDLASNIGIRGWEIIANEVTVTPGLKTVRAFCSAGKKVLGGGVRGLYTGNLVEHWISPIWDSPTYEDGSGYEFHFNNLSGGDWGVAVFAICAYTN